MKLKHFILDRDGTLIKYIPYLYEKEKVELISGTVEALNLLIEEKVKIYLHTNQSGVGRGLFKINDVEECNKRMIDLIGSGQNIFQDICIAPDYPPLKASYRKPSSLFANELIDKYNLDRDSIVYIGDSISDLITAKNTGCNAYGVMSGGYDLETLIKFEKDLNYDIFKNLLQVVNYLIENKKI